MESSSSSKEVLYDPIRKKWVKKTPEEMIRQHLIQIMVKELGYPPALLAIEKELSQLPHLKTTPSLPQRRVDILVFENIQGNLKPLLMIECKALPLTPQFAQQVIGYNAFVQAPFLAIANEKEVLLGCLDQASGIFKFQPGLVHFQVLRIQDNP